MRRRSLISGFRRRYGASPLHLASHLVALTIAAFAFDRIFSSGDAKGVLVWFLGFVTAHDLIFLPAYSGLDRLGRALLARVPGRRNSEIPIINHLRAPTLISALLLLIYSPLISGRDDHVYFALSGHHPEGYLRNWLLITVALFLGSGAIYALRRVRRGSTKGETDRVASG